MTTKVTGSVLANTAVTSGTYGGPTQHAVVTVDAQGRITYGANATPSIANTQITGLITSSQITSIANTQITGVIISTQIANTTVSAGTYGGASAIPVIVVDQQGRLTSASNVSINYTANNSNAQFSSVGVGTSADSANTGSIRATGSITAGYSDDNLKIKLGTIENALEKVMTLTGFYYEPNQTAQDLGYTMKKDVGVSAQDVEKVLPEVVVPAPIGHNYLTVHYEKLVPLLIEAIKELKQEIDVLKGTK